MKSSSEALSSAWQGVIFSLGEVEGDGWYKGSLILIPSESSKQGSIWLWTDGRGGKGLGLGLGWPLSSGGLRKPLQRVRHFPRLSLLLGNQSWGGPSRAERLPQEA